MPSEWDGLTEEQWRIASAPLKAVVNKRLAAKTNPLTSFGLEPEKLPPQVFERTPTRQATVPEVTKSD